MKITISTLVNAPIALVWDSYSNPEDIKVWNTASPDWHTTSSQVDLRVGGQFSSRMEAKDGSFGFDFAGVYTKLVPHELIEYSFGERVATVEFLNQAHGVLVRVSFDAEDTHTEEQQRNGWQSILDNFSKYVTEKHAS